MTSSFQKRGARPARQHTQIACNFAGLLRTRNDNEIDQANATVSSKRAHNYKNKTPMTPTRESTIRIAVVAAILNAGETTRAVEIANAVRDHAKENKIDVGIRFFATLYSIEKEYGYALSVTNAGFELDCAGPGLTPEEWKILHMRGQAAKESFLPSQADFVKQALIDLKNKLQDFQPTVVLHGYTSNYDGPIVAQILGIPNIAFLPVPLSANFLIQHLFPYVAETQFKYGFQHVPMPIYQSLLSLSYSLTKTLPYCQIPVIRQAAVEAGWEIQGSGDLLEAASADLVLVNDLQGNYDKSCLKGNEFFTGPVFPKTKANDQVGDVLDPEILRIFCPNKPNKKIFIAMGSSGHKNKYVEAIKAVNTGEYNVVAVVLPTKCTLQDVLDEVGELAPNVYVTDKFVPAKIVNAMADLAIIHGGQGTVQTAMSTGKSIIGVPHQSEQNFNLSAIQRRGAGLKIPESKFQAEYIRKCVEKVLDEPSFREAAQMVQKEIEGCDGHHASAEKILEFAMAHLHASA